MLRAPYEVFSLNFYQHGTATAFENQNFINPDMNEKWEATYINGVYTSEQNAKQVASLINESYRIKTTLLYNPNHTIPLSTDAPEGLQGFVNLIPDAWECFYAWPMSVLEFATPTTLDYSTDLMLQEWNRIRTSKKDILVVAHSEGAIFTQAGLYRFRTQNPFAFGHQESDWKFANTRMHALIFGTGFHFLTRFALPDDFNMVNTDMDRIAVIAGLENAGRSVLDALTFDVFNWDDERVRSYISDYAGPQFNEPPTSPYYAYSGHSWFTDLEEPNSYSWWTYWVGGPTFQKKNFNIHGEMAWVDVGDVEKWVYAYFPRNDWQLEYPPRERDKRVILKVFNPAGLYTDYDYYEIEPREGMQTIHP
jgi:hypothetical protein